MMKKQQAFDEEDYGIAHTKHPQYGDVKGLTVGALVKMLSGRDPDLAIVLAIQDGERVWVDGLDGVLLSPDQNMVIMADRDFSRSLSTLAQGKGETEGDGA